MAQSIRPGLSTGCGRTLPPVTTGAAFPTRRTRGYARSASRRWASPAGSTPITRARRMNYLGMKRHGASELARKPRLVIGPWTHGFNSTRKLVDIDYGAERRHHWMATSAGSSIII